MEATSDAMDISDDDVPASRVALQTTDGPSSDHSNGPSNHNSNENSDDDSDEDGVAFEVETILAQKKVSGSLEYLVKWAGYDLMNATWEPEDSFDSEDTLKDWQQKKLEINYGKLPTFNVRKWERDKSKLEDEFSAAGKDMEAHNSDLSTNMEDYFFPLLNQDPDPPRRSRHRLSSASDTFSSLFVTPEPTSSRDQAQPTLPPSSLSGPPEVSYPSIEDSESSVAETTVQQTSLDRDTNREDNPFKLPFPPLRRRLSVASDASSSLFVTPEPTSAKNQVLPAQPPLSAGQESAVSKPPVEDPKSQDATLQEKRGQQQSGQAPTSQSANENAGSTTKPSAGYPSAQRSAIQKPDTQQPSAENPSARRPAASKPLTQKPSAQRPAAQRSLPPKPAAQKPLPPKPVTQNHATQKPVAHKPPVVVPSRVGFGQSARPKFTRKRGYESTWGRERAPDPDEIQLMKPSEYSKRENYAHATPNVPGSKVPGTAAQSPVEGPATTGGADPASTSGAPPAPGPSEPMDLDPFVGQAQQLSLGDTFRNELNTPTLPLSTDRDSHRSTGPPRSSQIQGFSRRPSSPDNDNRQGVHEHTRRRSPGVYSRRFTESGGAAAASTPPALSEQEQIASMPVGRPQEGAIEWDKGLFNNPGEIFAHVYFGDLKTYIGPMRLVGQPLRAKIELLGSSVPMGQSLEIWFKELYTLKEHTELVNNGTPSRILSNAWMEGFESSNRNLFRMAEYLRKERMAAIYRPANCFASNWVAYSPETSFSNLLTKGSQSQFPRNVPIHLAIREALSVLPGTREPRPPSDEFLYAESLQGIPRGPKNRSEKTRKSMDSASLPFHPDVDHFSPAEPQSVPDSVPTPNECAPQPPTFSDVMNAFPNTHTRLLDELVSNFSTGSDGRLFYLHFPLGDKDVDDDFEFMSTWLGCFNIQFLSNRDDNNNEKNTGWMKFCNTRKNGVVIFHESFYDYATMRPSIRHAHRNPDIDFWNVRLKRPLDFPDMRYAKEGCHIQRLFPHGTALLVTEDVCQDMKELAILVYWFYKKCSGRRRGLELNQLVFWPDILGYFDKRLGDPARKKEDDPYILCIIAYIKYVNSDIDSASTHFEMSSLDIQNFESPNSNIVCLPLSDYGRRHEKDNNHPLLKHLTQPERNANHLVEAFSGWTLLNASCLRKTMVLSNHKNDRLLNQWASQGHVNVYTCKGFFDSLKLGPDFKAEVLQALQIGPKRDGESPLTSGDRSATTPRPPHTPRTPQEPQVRDFRDHSTFAPRTHEPQIRDFREHTFGGDPRASQSSRWAPPAPHGSRYPSGYR